MSLISTMTLTTGVREEETTPEEEEKTVTQNRQTGAGADEANSGLSEPDNPPKADLPLMD